MRQSSCCRSMSRTHSALLTVRDAAERLGVTPRTLKYYEERGLVSPTAARAATGFTTKMISSASAASCVCDRSASRCTASPKCSSARSNDRRRRPPLLDRIAATRFATPSQQQSMRSTRASKAMRRELKEAQKLRAELRPDLDYRRARASPARTPTRCSSNAATRAPKRRTRDVHKAPKTDAPRRSEPRMSSRRPASAVQRRKTARRFLPLGAGASSPASTTSTTPIFSFFTSYIAGGINASPDELVWSSSAYAVAAVLGILQQQWWVERLRLPALCGRLHAALCGRRGGRGALRIVARTGVRARLPGLFHRPDDGHLPHPDPDAVSRRSSARGALRAFLVLIVLSSALAPLVGGQLVAHFDWRALFACTAPVGVAFAVLAFLALPDSGNCCPKSAAQRISGRICIFAFAQGALQIVMQQVRFQFSATSPGADPADRRRHRRARLVRLSPVASSRAARAPARAARDARSRSGSCSTCSITTSRPVSAI